MPLEAPALEVAHLIKTSVLKEILTERTKNSQALITVAGDRSIALRD